MATCIKNKVLNLYKFQHITFYPLALKSCVSQLQDTDGRTVNGDVGNSRKV